MKAQQLPILLLPIVVCLLVGLTHNQCSAGQKTKPSTSPRSTPAIEQDSRGVSQREGPAYSANEFNSTVERLPRHYRGHNLEALYTILDKRTTTPKGEFETTAAFQERLARQQDVPLLGELTRESLYSFQVDAVLTSPVSNLKTSYDADHRELTLIVTVEYVSARVSIDLNSRALPFKHDIGQTENYEATNSYGARATVRKTYSKTYAVAFPLRGRIPLSSWGEMGKILGPNAFTTQITSDPEKVTRVREHLRVLAIGRLRHPYFSYGALLKKPAFSDPVDLFVQSYYLTLDLLELWFYDFATGEVYAKIR